MDSKGKPIETLGILLIDFGCIIFSYIAAIFIRFQSLGILGRDNIHIITLFCIILFCALYNMILPQSKNLFYRGHFEEFWSVSKFNLLLFVVWACILFLSKHASLYSRLVFGLFFVINLVSSNLTHFVFKKYLRLYYKNRDKQQVMLITDNENADMLISSILTDIDYEHLLTSLIIWDASPDTPKTLHGIPIMAAPPEQIIDVSRQMPLDEVFIYLPSVPTGTVNQLLMDFETMGVICHLNIDTGKLNFSSSTLTQFAGFTVLTYDSTQIDDWHKFVKRSMDIAGALIGLAITGILFPFIALSIKLDSKGPVLFSQVRIGKNGRRFKIYKFRSMYQDAEERKKEFEQQNEMQGLMFKLENDPRITKVGKFLRKTSLDELPQFYNILTGDMSLVGTRPPTVEEFEQYSPYYRRRLCFTPGLTGLWQINGRSDISNFDEVVKYDLFYIDYWSIKLDLKILFQTILVVFTGKGAK